RTRKDGDCIMPFGLKGRKKLKEIFIEKRIPRFLRNLWPVIEDKRGVVFVPGVVRSERGRLNKKTRDVLIIKYERIKDE
ncbi:tRNA lysidine(34) synthetase TilS, partial [candidate division WOR-3 bacterium]|nr:tRNA lysidine(34) synthetase TilS [candidate division WOR-3 bacterium]